MTYDDRDLQGSEIRLWKLVEERSRPGLAADEIARIDERIWDLFGEEWAIVFTDLSGFSRQVAAFGIVHFLQIIFEQKRLLLPIAARHDGILVKVEADSFLLIFKRPASAVRCLVEMQHACASYNALRHEEDRVLLCAGVGFGRILRIGDSDVYGQEVNAASKLGEDTARANEILVTSAVRDVVGKMEGVTLEPIDVAVPGSATNYRVLYPGFQAV